MKTIQILGIIGALLSVSANYNSPVAPNETGTTPGRYLLASGVIAGDKSNTAVMLRIDTATGFTWQLNEMPGGIPLYWQPIPENVTLALQLLSDAMSAANSNNAASKPTTKPSKWSK
jgi:hypothetical protein